MKDFLFRMRGFTPVPFLAASLYWAEINPAMIAFGALMAVLGELLRIWALRHAGGATRTREVGAPGLVTSGPYAMVRNPLYLANMLLYVGFAIGSYACFPWLPLATLVFFSWQYLMIIRLEENTLIQIFGDQYRDYQKRTPRLFPSFNSDSPQKPANYSLASALREERSTLLGLIVCWILLVARLFLISSPA